MPVSITGTLSKRDLAEMVEKLAENPEFAAKLEDAISERLDKKYGWRQGELTSDFEKLEGQFKALNGKIDHMQHGIDTLAHNFTTFGERQDLFSRELGKVNTRLDSIDGHLGIKTNTRGQERFGGTGAGTGQKEF